MTWRDVNPCYCVIGGFHRTGVWGWWWWCAVKMIERWCGVEERTIWSVHPWSLLMSCLCDVVLSLCDVLLFSYLIVVFDVMLFLMREFMLFATQLSNEISCFMGRYEISFMFCSYIVICWDFMLWWDFMLFRLLQDSRMRLTHVGDFLMRRHVFACIMFSRDFLMYMIRLWEVMLLSRYEIFLWDAMLCAA